MHHTNALIVSDAANTHMMQLSENVVYLMGLSFILGSFFTILVLLLLDFMRRDSLSN